MLLKTAIHLALSISIIGYSKAEINWIENYDQGLQKANEVGKPVMLYFGADWCGPCRNLRSTTLADSDIVQKINEFFVPIFVDLTNKTDANTKIYKQYVKGRGAIPHISFLRPSGDEINQLRHIGTIGKTELMARLEKALSYSANKQKEAAGINESSKPMFGKKQSSQPDFMILGNGHIIRPEHLNNSRVIISVMDGITHDSDKDEIRKIKYAQEDELQQKANKLSVENSPASFEVSQDVKQQLDNIVSDFNKQAAWRYISSLDNDDLLSATYVCLGYDEDIAKTLLGYIAIKHPENINKALLVKIENGTDYEAFLSIHMVNLMKKRDITPTIRGFLSHDDYRIANESITYLTRVEDHQSIEDIFKRSNDSNIESKSLESIKYFYENGHKEKVTTILGDYINDPAFTPQVLTFIYNNQVRGFNESIIELTKSRDKRIKLSAMLTGAKLKIKEIKSLINQILKNGEDETTVKAAIEASINIKDSKNLRLLVERLKDDNEEIKLLAGYVLRKKTGLNFPSSYDQWIKLVE